MIYARLKTKIASFAMPCLVGLSGRSIIIMPIEKDPGDGPIAAMKRRLAKFETEEGRLKVSACFMWCGWFVSP